MSLRVLPPLEPRPRGPAGRIADRITLAAGTRLLSGMPAKGCLTITLPDGQRVVIGPDEPGLEARLDFPNLRTVLRGIRNGSLGFGESYVAGDVTSPNLVAFLRFYLQNQSALEEAGDRYFFRVRLPDRIKHLMRANTRAGARRNIAAHYDLSNEFYRLWLDDSMTYSSAYFKSGANDLATAQQAKYRKVMEAMEVGPGDRVLEIGCGWGGFAEAVAREAGASVTGITLSREQLAYARKRLGDAGLDTRCDMRLQDYRDVSGTFDRIASIEMIEAVGEAHWPAYFATLANRLRRSGVAAVQAITIAEPIFDTYRRSVDFIQRHIFPGGMLPTAEIIERHAAAAGLRLDRVETFGQCYARTLATWRRRFLDVWPQIASLGFDEDFRRKWEYYLAYCEAGFAEGTIDVGIYRLVKEG
jgi:cyclopropane-fatty-acyl-phospholipid synthase